MIKKNNKLPWHFPRHGIRINAMKLNITRNVMCSESDHTQRHSQILTQMGHSNRLMYFYSNDEPLTFIML